MTDYEDLGRRAVACKGWRWMQGMAFWRGSFARPSCGLVLFDDTSVEYIDDAGRSIRGPITSEDVPDLSDPATLGCLLALVREAWGEPRCVPYSQTQGTQVLWLVYGEDADDPLIPVWSYSEVEALVAALEAAP